MKNFYIIHLRDKNIKYNVNAHNTYILHYLEYLYEEL